MDKYKAIVCDFDGTLVGRELVISEAVQRSIRSLAATGIRFILASGRSYTGLIRQACHDLQLTAPQITRGGAEIIDPTNDTVVHSQLIPDTEATKLIRILSHSEVEYLIEKDSFAYSIDGKPMWQLGPIRFKKFTELKIHKLPKIVLRSFKDKHHETEVMELLRNQFPTLHIVKSQSPVGDAWDITAGMANKHAAVLHVAKLLQLDRGEIIGIGDGYNDFPLLEACGYKVAMDNAHDELKAIADRVIPSYQEDGVATFITDLTTGRI